MRFLYFILDGYPTFRPDVAALWGRYLPREGISCDISTIRNVREARSVEWESGTCFLFEPPRNKVLEQLGAFWHDCRVLWRQRRAAYDAVQGRDKSFICLPALWYARARGVPFYYWMSWPIAESLARQAGTLSWRRALARRLFLAWRGHVGGWLLRHWVLPRCDHIFVQSERMRDDLAALGLPRDKMTPVPMCIDPLRFAEPLPPPKGEPPARPPVIGYLGECSKERRIDFLLEVTAIVKRSEPDIEFLIVGDALEEEDKRALRAGVTELGLDDNVRITGWLPTDAAMSAFSTVDVALALMAPDPLLDSATPTKLVEYLAMGRPVVANDHPDQSWVLRQSGGGVCTPYDMGAYARAVLYLLQDRDERIRLAESGRAWVMQHRAYDKMAHSLSARYYSIRRPASGG